MSGHPGNVRPTKSRYAVNVDGLPQDLLACDRWLLWRYVQVEGESKPRKMPFRALHPDQTASSTDPDSWCGFDLAHHAAKVSDSGLGFALGDGFAGIDLDQVIDDEGKVSLWAKRIVDRLASYTEVSPSGRGLHVLVRATLPPVGRKKEKLEMYDTGRYFTTSGRHLPGTPRVVAERTEVVAQIHKEYFGQAEPRAPGGNGKHAGPPPADADVDQVIAMLRGRDARFDALFLGKWGELHLGDGSQSSADLALCGFITRGARPDPALIDAIYRKSGLMRAKWDTRRGATTYGRQTIDRAIADASRRPAAAPRAEDPAGPGPAGGSAGPPPGDPFPVELLPSPLQAFVLEGAAALGCQVEYVALPVITMLGACVGTKRSVYIKRTWSEHPIFWTACIGESGQLKTPAQSVALKPLRLRQRELQTVYERALKEHEREKEGHEKRLADWHRRRSGGVTMDHPPTRPEEPTMTQFLADDATWESLASVLAANPAGVLLARDELAGWFSFDAYRQGKGGDVSRFLSAHQAGAVTVNRKTGTPKYLNVPRAAVAITGGIQPHVIKSVLRGQGPGKSGNNFDNGLAARFLLAWPEKVAKVWTEEDLSLDTERAMEDLVGRLLALEFKRTGPEPGDVEPVAVPMTAAGKEAWIGFYDAHNREAREQRGDLASAWAKLEGYTARFAVLFALIEVRDEVDAPHVEAGAKLSQWFANEAARIYSYIGSTVKESEAEKLRRIALQVIDGLGGEAAPRDLHNRRRVFRDMGVSDIEAFLRTLVPATLEVVEINRQGKGRDSVRFRRANVANVDAPQSGNEEDRWEVG